MTKFWIIKAKFFEKWNFKKKCMILFDIDDVLGKSPLNTRSLSVAICIWTAVRPLSQMAINQLLHEAEGRSFGKSLSSQPLYIQFSSSFHSRDWCKKTYYCPRNRPIIKIHNFYPINLILPTNDLLLSPSFIKTG